MDRYTSTKIASILGIFGNIFLLCIKAIVGFTTKSQAMIADSINSASDILASLMSYIGNKISSKPKDDSHNLGHGKAEYIFSMLISIIMIVVSFELFINSISSLINKKEYEFSWTLVIVCIITIITKLMLYIYTSFLARKFNNILVYATAKDHRNDCFITTCTLVSTLLSLKNIYWIDSIVGCGISIWIFITGVDIFIKSANVLMDKSLDNDIKQKIIDIINTYPQIKKIQHFNSTPIGYRYQISFTIYVDGKLPTVESHKIANDLEKEIDAKIEEVSLTVIHVNPL